MKLKTKISTEAAAAVSFSESLRLADGRQTTIHVVRYQKEAYKPRLVIFDQLQRLLDWCQDHDVNEAVSGGYFLRSNNKFLGEIWSGSLKLPSVSIDESYNLARGGIYIPRHGAVKIAARQLLPVIPHGDLLQAGPLLITDGKVVVDDNDCEGFLATANLHDEYINCKRFPRAAIAANKSYFWTITCDGRSPQNAGLYLNELAEVAYQLGATEALNLDGGRSATQIHNAKLFNRPRSDYTASPRGYKIHSALVFDSL